MATKIGMEFPAGSKQEGSGDRNTTIDSAVEEPVRQKIERPSDYQEKARSLNEIREEWRDVANRLRQDLDRRTAEISALPLEQRVERMKMSEGEMTKERIKAGLFEANATAIKRVLDKMDQGVEPGHGSVESVIDQLKVVIKNTDDQWEIIAYEGMVNWLAKLPTFSNELQPKPLRGIERSRIQVEETEEQKAA